MSDAVVRIGDQTFFGKAFKVELPVMAEPVISLEDLGRSRDQIEVRLSIDTTEQRKGIERLFRLLRNNRKSKGWRRHVRKVKAARR